MSIKSDASYCVSEKYWHCVVQFTECIFFNRLKILSVTKTRQLELAANSLLYSLVVFVRISEG